MHLVWSDDVNTVELFFFFRTDKNKTTPKVGKTVDRSQQLPAPYKRLTDDLKQIWPTVQRQPGYYNEKRRIERSHERLESSRANGK